MFCDYFVVVFDGKFLRIFFRIVEYFQDAVELGPRSSGSQSSVWAEEMSHQTSSRLIVGPRHIRCPTALTACLPTREYLPTFLHYTLNNSRAKLDTSRATTAMRKKRSTTLIINEWASFSSSKQPSIPSHGLISV